MPLGFAELGTWTSTPWENRELAQVPSSRVWQDVSEAGTRGLDWRQPQDKRDKAHRSYLSSSFLNSPTTTHAMWEKPRAEAVNHSWPVTPLHCQQPAKWRTMQTRPFHSIIPAQSMWIRLVKHISHSHSWKQRDKCTSNLECWGEDWVLGKLVFPHAIFTSHLKRDDH